MEPPSATARAAAAPRPPSFASQTNALLRKNLIFQKRNRKGTIRLIIVPIYLCLIISVLQRVINNFLDKPKYRCGCKCVDVNGTGPCQNLCGIQYSTLDQAPSCPIPNPPKWPALVQVPLPEYRAVQDSSGLFTGFPDKSCRKTQSCATIVPFAGANRTLSNSIMQNLFTSSPLLNLSDYKSISSLLLGTDVPGSSTGFVEPAFISARPIYVLQPQCKSSDSVTIPVAVGSVNAQKALGAEKAGLEAGLQEAELRCEEGLAVQKELRAAVDAARRDLEAAQATLSERTSAYVALTGTIRPVLEEFGVAGAGESGVVLSLQERIACLPAWAREQASGLLRRGTQTVLGMFASHYKELDQKALGGGWAPGVPFETCMELEAGMAELAGKMSTLVEREIIPIDSDDEEPETEAPADQ